MGFDYVEYINLEVSLKYKSKILKSQLEFLISKLYTDFIHSDTYERAQLLDLDLDEVSLDYLDDEIQELYISKIYISNLSSGICVSVKFSAKALYIDYGRLIDKVSKYVEKYNLCEVMSTILRVDVEVDDTEVELDKVDYKTWEFFGTPVLRCKNTELSMLNLTDKLIPIEVTNYELLNKKDKNMLSMLEKHGYIIVLPSYYRKDLWNFHDFSIDNFSGLIFMAEVLINNTEEYITLLNRMLKDLYIYCEAHDILFYKPFIYLFYNSENKHLRDMELYAYISKLEKYNVHICINEGELNRLLGEINM